MIMCLSTFAGGIGAMFSRLSDVSRQLVIIS
jgi:hypothetical protein